MVFPDSPLVSVVIGAGATNIINWAFASCANLAHVTIGSGITTIGHHVFSECTSLTHVTIPPGVIMIGHDAFKSCSNLTRVYFAGKPPGSMGNAVFSSTPATLCIYYLPAFASFWPDTFAYRSTKLWNPAFTHTALTAGQISCTVTGAPPIPIAFEATTNLATGPWVRLQTTTLTDTSLILHDSSSQPARFYRIVGP